MKTVKTSKGTELPLLNLKGKDYLQVAHRIQWFNESESNFEINTSLVSCTEEETVARAEVIVKDTQGNVIKKATATKRENKSHFVDHTEKAETAALGRALAMLGYGTQFAISDLDEGERLADAPLDNPKTAEPVKTNGFRKPKVNAAPTSNAIIDTQSSSDGWE